MEAKEKKRYKSTLLLIPLALIATIWPGGILFSMLLCLVVILLATEFCDGSDHVAGMSRLVCFSGVVIPLIAVFFSRHELLPTGYSIPGIVVALVLLSELVSSSWIISATSPVRCLLYLGLMPSSLVFIRMMGTEKDVFSWQGLGVKLSVALIVTVWALDIFAYLVGSTFGGRKLWPRVSPGKTWSGAIGGFIAAVAVGTLLMSVFRLPPWHGLLLGVLVGVVGQIGDLVESAWKRKLGIKDSNRSDDTGHGGVMDRFDSLIFVAPLAYVMLRLLGY